MNSGILMAQTLLCRCRRRHHGDVRVGYLSCRGTGLLRAFLDCYDAFCKVAAVAILIAAASNNVAKGIYGIQGLLLLVALAALGLVPMIWLGS